MVGIETETIEWEPVEVNLLGESIMTAGEILEELKALGSENIKKVLVNHGVREPFFGVKIGDMKPIVKRIKKNYPLALDLYDTGNYDAMYLAGLIADDSKMTKKDLNRWVKKAQGGCLASATVSWVAAGSKHGYDISREWIESSDETTVSAGWATLGHIVALQSDENLEIPELKNLIKRIEKTIHDQPSSIRLAMMSFMSCLGVYVLPLTDAVEIACTKIGTVSVDMGPTACKVPNPIEMIDKVRKRGSLGKKRKMVKC